MSSKIEIALLVLGSSICILNVALAIVRHFRGRGPSPGSIGGFIPLLLVLLAQDWPLWLRIVLAPATVALEFSWLLVYLVLDRVFPRSQG